MRAWLQKQALPSASTDETEPFVHVDKDKVESEMYLYCASPNAMIDRVPFQPTIQGAREASATLQRYVAPTDLLDDYASKLDGSIEDRVATTGKDQSGDAIFEHVPHHAGRDPAWSLHEADIAGTGDTKLRKPPVPPGTLDVKGNKKPVVPPHMAALIDVNEPEETDVHVPAKQENTTSKNSNVFDDVTKSRASFLEKLGTIQSNADAGMYI